MLAPALSLIGSYFLGSIPFGLLASTCKGVDIRKPGRGTIGATNVWLVCGRPSGLPALVPGLNFHFLTASIAFSSKPRPRLRNGRLLIALPAGSASH